MKEENIKGEYQRKVDKSLIPTCNIMGVNIAAINMNWLLKYIDENLSDIKGDYICVSNVHTTVTSYEDAAYCAVQNGGLMAIPDGGPLSSVGRKRGYSDMDRTTGPSLMGEIFKISAEKGYRHYFYGSTEETLKLLEEKLQENYPGIQIAGMYSPPFRPLTEEEDKNIIENINKTKPDFVWIGLGAPKQEKWMAEHQGKIDGLMLGVGAGFDYYAENIKRAPMWMQKSNLEWLYRLMQDPKRLFKRYFHAIAEYVISCGGVVFGCEFSDDRVCRHTMATDISNLGKFQGSKYVQSELGDCFKSIKEQLDADKKVLFIGMPCQVAGLESYIKRNKENLYLMDLACHGVPSPGVFKDFIQFLEHKYKGKISNFVFRDKTYGYSATNIKVYFANGKTIDCRNDIKTFTRLMFKGITLRPSCYECAFKTKHRVSDITIFDCALVGSYNKDMDDDIGTTSILCHSDKGKKLLEQPDVIDKMRIKSVDSEELILTEGSMLIASAKKSENREAFFHDRELMTYEQLTNKYAPITLKMIIGDIVKRSLRYTGPIGKAVILNNKKKSIEKYQREFMGRSGENETAD